MSIYKDHAENVKAAAIEEAALAKAKLDEETAKTAQLVADGRVWLETVALPELLDAKTAVEHDLVVDYSEQAIQRRYPFNGYEVIFTINRRSGGRRRSFVFAVMTDGEGQIRSEVRQPSEEGYGQDSYRVDRKDTLSGSLEKVGVSDFQEYLKSKISDALKL